MITSQIYHKVSQEIDAALICLHDALESDGDGHVSLVHVTARTT
jgi:hypothetical protein